MFPSLFMAALLAVIDVGYVTSTQSSSSSIPAKFAAANSLDTVECAALIDGSIPVFQLDARIIKASRWTRPLDFTSSHLVAALSQMGILHEGTLVENENGPVAYLDFRSMHCRPPLSQTYPPHFHA
jgi:hypothetical protein